MTGEMLSPLGTGYKNMHIDYKTNWGLQFEEFEQCINTGMLSDCIRVNPTDVIFSIGNRYCKFKVLYLL